MTTFGGRYKVLECVACGPGSSLSPLPAYRGRCTACGLEQSIATTDEERAFQADHDKRHPRQDSPR
jgi:hypothetical protein